MTIKDRRVSVADLTWVIEDNNLGSEVRDSRCRLVLGVRGDVSSLDVLHGDVLDVEADVVSGHGLGERLVVHLHGLDLGGQHVGGEGDDHPGLDDARLNSAHGNCSNTSDFVDILEKSNYFQHLSKIYRVFLIHTRFDCKTSQKLLSDLGFKLK